MQVGNIQAGILKVSWEDVAEVSLVLPRAQSALDAELIGSRELLLAVISLVLHGPICFTFFSTIQLELPWHEAPLIHEELPNFAVCRNSLEYRYSSGARLLVWDCMCIHAT